MKPKKHLGQNFLQDRNIAEKIISLLNPNETIFEIGPGTGALTRYLNDMPARVIAFEVDERAVEHIRAEYASVEVLHRDFLKVTDTDFEPFAPLQVVGNIPYYITSPILFRLFEFRHFITKAIIMMQYEVAKRLTASPGTKEYGIMSVQAQLFSEVRFEFKVLRTVFYPKPNVDSAVVSFLFNKSVDVSDESLKRVVRTAFNQRRKKMSNSLKGVDGFEKAGKEWLDKRPDALTPQEFVKLTKLILGE